MISLDLPQEPLHWSSWPFVNVVNVLFQRCIYTVHGGVWDKLFVFVIHVGCPISSEAHKSIPHSWNSWLMSRCHHLPSVPSAHLLLQDIPQNKLLNIYHNSIIINVISYTHAIPAMKKICCEKQLSSILKMYSVALNVVLKCPLKHPCQLLWLPRHSRGVYVAWHVFPFPSLHQTMGMSSHR